MILPALLAITTSLSLGQNAYVDAVKSTPGLMGYWRLETVDGGLVPDESGSGNTGVLAGSLTLTEGALGPGGGSGLHCVPQGTDASNMNIAPTAALEGVPFTAEFWVRVLVKGNNLDRSLFRQTSTSHGRHLYVGLLATSEAMVRANFSAYDSGTTNDIYSVDSLPLAQWHLIDVVAGPALIELYVDGALNRAPRVGGPTPATLLSDPISLLCNNEEVVDFDELALYDGELDAPTIKSHYQLAVSMRGAGGGDGGPHVNAFALGCSSSPHGAWLGGAGILLGLLLLGARRRGDS